MSSNKAIVVKLVKQGDKLVMRASSIGERGIQRDTLDLPTKQPAHALALLMCHRNGWATDLVYGLLPNGDEVFCFRHNRG
jgi:hypothetical protein